MIIIIIIIIVIIIIIIIIIKIIIIIIIIIMIIIIIIKIIINFLSYCNLHRFFRIKHLYINLITVTQVVKLLIISFILHSFH